MKGAVVVVSFGSAHLLAEGLVPLSEAAPELLVVVVDSWSGEPERARVRLLATRQQWLLVEPDGNTGFGVGADLGIAAATKAGCDAVVLLNPDAVASASTVRELLRAAAADEGLLLSPVVTRGDGEPWFTAGDLDLVHGRTSTRGRLRSREPASDGEPTTAHVAHWLSGACLAVSTAGWAARGGFDTRYFLYWEDVELSLRWSGGGGRLAVRDDLFVTHDVGGTQGDGKSPLYVRYNCRNRLLTAALLGPRTFLRWSVAAPAYAWEVVRRGGRRRLLRRPGLLLASARGTAEGLAVGATALFGGRTDGTSALPRVRLYQTLRTAHLEQALELAPATILYRGRRYDFDERLAGQLDLRRGGPIQLAWWLLRHPLRELEVNEPLMRYAIRGTALGVVAAKLGALLRGHRLTVVTYCIELVDHYRPGAGHGGRVRLLVDRALSRLVWRLTDRVVFGTEASRSVYARLLPSRAQQRTALLLTLPQACGCPEVPLRDGEVLFLGALSERKGFPLVLRAWSVLREERKDATLTVVGKGALEGEARRLAERDPRVELVLDPPRHLVHEHLRRAQVVVLPSQRERGWREQLGLPLTEGMAHGCSVVTTEETGLAAWLASHGHRVLPAEADAHDLAAALAEALAERREPLSVLADLPQRDGRLAADDWLFSED